MKRKIFNHIKDNPGVDLHTISKAVNVEEIKVLDAIEALLKEGFICLCTPVSLSLNNSNSCRYKVIKPEYTE